MKLPQNHKFYTIRGEDLLVGMVDKCEVHTFSYALG